jgi:Organic solute transporter Ostalpha
MQYVIIRPAVSVVGIITNALGVYCESGGYNPHFAYVYLTGVDFISITSVGQSDSCLKIVETDAII